MPAEKINSLFNSSLNDRNCMHIILLLTNIKQCYYRETTVNSRPFKTFLVIWLDNTFKWPPVNNTCIITLFHVIYKPGVRVSSGRISESKKSIVNKWNNNANLTTEMKKKRSRKTRKLPTYPSPNPALSLTSHLGQNVGLGEG